MFNLYMHYLVPYIGMSLKILFYSYILRVFTLILFKLIFKNFKFFKYFNYLS